MNDSSAFDPSARSPDPDDDSIANQLSQPRESSPEKSLAQVLDEQYMRRGLELAEQGRGQVEPNPMVGCVIVRDGCIVGEGYHQQFGGPHAEVVALRTAGDAARGATLYVTLEPCCHWGKTPPCTGAIIAAGVRRVVVAQRDPFPAVAGQGVEQLRSSGIEVSEGVLSASAKELNSAYHKLISCQQPWLIAKWAMTWDGKIASRTRDSRWISSAHSRSIVHELRGQVDAIAVGIGTVIADDPLLTARPPGRRMARRLVIDWLADLPLTSQLVSTADQVPVWVAVSDEAAAEKVGQLSAAGCEMISCAGDSSSDRLASLLRQLGQQRLTNVLVEGGSGLLGALFDMQAIDEVRVFLGAKILGGSRAISPLGGSGLADVAEAATLRHTSLQVVGQDIYLRGRVEYSASEQRVVVHEE